MDMMMTDLMTNANAAGDAAQATVKYQIKNSSLTVMLHGYRVIERQNQSIQKRKCTLYWKTIRLD